MNWRYPVYALMGMTVFVLASFFITPKKTAYPYNAELDEFAFPAPIPKPIITTDGKASDGALQVVLESIVDLKAKKAWSGDGRPLEKAEADPLFTKFGSMTDTNTVFVFQIRGHQSEEFTFSTEKGFKMPDDALTVGGGQAFPDNGSLMHYRTDYIVGSTIQVRLTAMKTERTPKAIFVFRTELKP